MLRIFSAVFFTIVLVTTGQAASIAALGGKLVQRIDTATICGSEGHCAGDHCLQSNECNGALVCTNNICASAQFCSWEDHCEGNNCVTSDDCSDDLICSNCGDPSSCGTGICTYPSDCTWHGHCAGAVCATDDDCFDPTSCQNGICAY